MKRILVLLLALAMLFCLTACGGDKESTPTGENAGASTNRTQDYTQGTDDSTIDGEDNSSVETTTPPSSNTATTDPTHTHKYVDKVTASTCIKEGYTLHTCNCGDSYSDNKTAATGHSFGEWNTTKEPTTTETGTAERKCSKCNETQTKVLGRLIENHKHSYTSKITIQPTCKAEGQKTYSCSCGDTYSEPVASVDHQYSHRVTNPTCTNEGYTTYTCTVCGNSYRDSFTHPTGHDWIASTCTTPSTCRVCGITEGSADGHNYSRWDIWDYPTCTEEGHEVSWCTRCANRELRPVKPRGHKYVAGICSVCGADNNVYANVNGVTLNHTTLSLKIGDIEQLTETVMPQNAKDKAVTWSSSNSSVAQISSTGKVTAKGEGTAVITVTTKDGGYTASCNVTVSVIHVNGVSLNQTALNMTVGKSQQLTATVSPSNADNKNVTWSSSNSSVAQVSSTGKVTAKGKGSATITVTTADGNYIATCTITVTEAPLTVSVSIGIKSSVGSSGSVHGVAVEAIASGGSGSYVEYYIKVYHNGSLVAEGTKAEIIVTLANGQYTAEVYVKDSSGNEVSATKTTTISAG